MKIRGVGSRDVDLKLPISHLHPPAPILGGCWPRGPLPIPSPPFLPFSPLPSPADWLHWAQHRPGKSFVWGLGVKLRRNLGWSRRGRAFSPAASAEQTGGRAADPSRRRSLDAEGGRRARCPGASQPGRGALNQMRKRGLLTDCIWMSRNGVYRKSQKFSDL